MDLASVLVRCCVVLHLVVAAEWPTDDHEPRPKRSLVYPSPSTLLLIFGLGTPLQLERESVIVGAFAKMIYALPTNSTSYSEPWGAKQQRTRSRWSLYRTLGQLAELYGLGEAKSCVMRAVCEAAAAPFDPRRGLLHQLLQTFLSPSSTAEAYEQYQDREYHAAEAKGRAQQHCHALYPECRASLLDVFSAPAPRRPRERQPR